MKFIKLAFLSIVPLFLVVTGVSLFIPSSVRLSKAINLHGYRDSVMSLIRDTNQWKRWNPPFMGDSAGNLKARPNAVLIRSNDSEVVYQFLQPGKKPVISSWRIYHLPASDSLTLQWYLDLHSSWYPWQKLGTLLYEPTFGAMMQEGLTNVKNIEQGGE